MGGTILIVEDETRLAEILEDYLRREGYCTERAKNGGRALELWRATQPDLIPDSVSSAPDGGAAPPGRGGRPKLSA